MRALLLAVAVAMALTILPTGTRAEPVTNDGYTIVLVPITLDGLPRDDVARAPWEWDESEQAWRDLISGLHWWASDPGWVLADGLGHFWFWGAWRYQDGSLYVPPTPSIVFYYESGVEQWRSAVASLWPSWAVDKVLAVMRCESEGNPNVTGLEGEQGLMQMKAFHGWRVGWANMYDPHTNLRAAHHLWLEQGWGPWTCA